MRFSSGPEVCRANDTNRQITTTSGTGEMAVA
jgi:hypothetical protein